MLLPSAAPFCERPPVYIAMVPPKTITDVDVVWSIWLPEDYGRGMMVAWNLPGRPLLRGYQAYDGGPAVAAGILRDGFDRERELHFLERAD